VYNIPLSPFRKHARGSSGIQYTARSGLSGI